MITVGNKKVILTGVQIVTGINYVISKNTVVNATSCYVLDENGNLAEPEIIGYVTEQPHTIVADTTTMVTGRTTINGNILPVNKKVYVSPLPASNELVFDDLLTTCITSTQADENGDFIFTLDSDEANKEIIVWSEITSDYNDASMADIDLVVTYESDLEPMLVKRFFKFTASDVVQSTPSELNEGTSGTEGAVPTIEYTLYGNCPEDADCIYISTPRAVYDNDAEMLAELEATVHASITPGSGSYMKTYSTNIYEPDVDYCVWCQSIISTNITANFTSSSGDVEPVCLSGDTLILLYDGTQKRLRNLTVDDVLMSGKSEPTNITQIKLGGESSFHTLYYFNDGTVIDEAHRHRFYNVEAGYWKYLDEWRIGDHAKCYDGSEPRLVKLERLEEPRMRYGLWTESHDYFANGLLSGETAANQSVLSEASIKQVVDMLSSLSPDKLEKLYKGELG